jgi:2-desacetyl-2-hydroxyethyl bacteriochlorophyllide A dehydrogenase
MKALQLVEPKHWNMIDLPEPDAPGPGEALVRVEAVGICGTDYGGYLGKMPFFRYPRIPGHELGVEVIAVGPDVTNVKPGDRCCVEPYINCQQCHACRLGKTNCCEHHQTLGVHCDGGLRPAFSVLARKLHRSPNLTAEQNALVETLAIGCHAVDRGGVTRGENVLVIGAGPIGLSALEFVRLAGGRPIVMDRVPSRLDFVQTTLGVPDTILADGTSADVTAVADRTAGAFCELVIDATGNATSMSNSLEFAAFGGRVVYVGITQETLTLPHAPLLHRRELTILASRNAASRDFARIIADIEDGRIDTQPWITHRLDWKTLPDAFPQLVDPASGVLKAVATISE